MARIRDEESFQKKRLQILDVAAQCFIESGFHGTGMAKICKAAGISPGALYRYFPSKESMIEAIVEQERADADLFLADLAQAKNKAKGLAKMMSDAVLFLAKTRSYCQLSVEISAEAARSEVIAQLLAETDTNLIEALMAAVEKGQVAGDIDETLAPETTAQLLMMMVDGFVGRLAVTTDWDVAAIARQVEVAVFKLLSAPVV
ncbi:MAG: TetR/AcrR family transcriptional regulator [Cyanobacteria bacterium J06623_4]